MKSWLAGDCARENCPPDAGMPGFAGIGKEVLAGPGETGLCGAGFAVCGGIIPSAPRTAGCSTVRKAGSTGRYSELSKFSRVGAGLGFVPPAAPGGLGGDSGGREGMGIGLGMQVLYFLLKKHYTAARAVR